MFPNFLPQEGGADETVENPKKKTKKASKWSQHKREQVKLLQEAKLKKKEERQRRERVKERLKEVKKYMLVQKILSLFLCPGIDRSGA